MATPLLLDPDDSVRRLAMRSRRRRLDQRLTQLELAERAGLGKSTVERWERDGKATVANVLRIALVLGTLGEWEDLFAPLPARNLSELIEPPLKQRVRKS